MNALIGIGVGLGALVVGGLILFVVLPFAGEVIFQIFGGNRDDFKHGQ